MNTRDYDREYERGRYERGYYEDRGLMERAGDEVRSWFGDEDAERRRHRDYRWDEQRHREGRYAGSRYDFDDVRAHEIMTRNI